MKTKKLNVVIDFSMSGTSSIMVPDDLTFKEAIEYAKQHINEIPTPENAYYISDSDIINEELCYFE